MDFFAIWIFCIFCPGAILIIFLTMYAFHDQYKRLNNIDKNKDNDFK